MKYLEIIKYAIIFFPLVAFLFTFPFILVEYHKFGSISVYKSFILYLFILYLICAYFLVILPLPTIREVALLKTPRTQLVPFMFIVDFIKNSSFDIKNINTYFGVLKESYFYVPLFNILLTVPFGFFLKYYLKFDLKKIALSSFLLSLFFELTQLSGLYFIYPRGYRLFDVDDLILNTLGGVVGYLLCKPWLKILPEREKIEKKALEKGKNISGLKRTVSFILDLFLCALIDFPIKLILSDPKYLMFVVIGIYYFLIPLFLNNSTLGEKFLNMKVVNYQNEENYQSLFIRRITFVGLYIVIPYIIYKIIFILGNNVIIKIIGGFYFIGIIFFYFFEFLKYLFTKKEMLYEKISKTKLISTIKTS